MFGLSIDMENLEKLIKDFNTLTGIRIAFLNTDGKQIAVYQKDSALFCSLLRKNPEADSCCIKCDREAFLRAREKRGLYLYRCHAGLTEAVSPIIINSEIAGYMMFGQVLDLPPSEELWVKILNSCRSFIFDFDAMKNAFYMLSAMEPEKLLAAARIMEMSASYIHMSRLVTVKHLSLIEKIKKHVKENIYEDITISTLSSEFSMSKSYLSRLIKGEFKMPLSDYILKVRVKRAEELLANSNLPVKDIGLSLGFTDPNYFSRAFKKEIGISPTEYRKR